MREVAPNVIQDASIPTAESVDALNPAHDHVEDMYWHKGCAACEKSAQVYRDGQDAKQKEIKAKSVAPEHPRKDWRDIVSIIRTPHWTVDQATNYLIEKLRAGAPTQLNEKTNKENNND